MSTQDGDISNNLAVFQNSQGAQVSASLSRLTPQRAVLEIRSPELLPRMSEVLRDFQIIVNHRTVYSGSATVSNLLPAGTRMDCEVKLEQAGQVLTPLRSAADNGSSLRHQFNDFLGQWQTTCRVQPEFKNVIGDLQSFLGDLRLWLNQIDREIRALPSTDRQQKELEVIDQLAPLIGNGIDTFIQRFDAIARQIEPELQPVHQAYLRRQLHPLVLCSPFASRTFHKPLGYAGDYEVVDMMLRSPHEGTSLFAKAINVWLLDQTPARAHRNRVAYLERKLIAEALRLKALGRTGRVYNLGCGPAAEVQRLLAHQPLADQLAFSLLDFNDETLAHVRATLEQAKRSHSRATPIQFIKQSVHQILKESPRTPSHESEQPYDFVYCAGLFDYLPDPVCKRLMPVLYRLLAPGGLLLVTNVSDAMNGSRPFRLSMEYLLDWHLIYRDGAQLAALAPETAPRDTLWVLGEESGVNVFLEVRKPRHG